MNLFAFLRTFIARTFLTAYAGPGKTTSSTGGAPIVAPPPDWQPPAAPEGKGEEEEPEEKDEPADPDEKQGEEPGDEDEDEDDDEEQDDLDDDGDEKEGEEDDDEEDDDDASDLARESLQTRLAATIKGAANPYDARFDVGAIKVSPETRKAVLSKLLPKDADDDEKAGAEAIADSIEVMAKEIALGLLGGYHNAAVVPVRESLDRSAGRAAMEREAEAVAAKNPELHDDAVQKRIVAELDKLDAEFGPQVRRHLTVKGLLRLVPRSVRAAARTRVLEARGKSAGKRKEPRELTDEEQREVALSPSSAPRSSKSSGVPGRKTKPEGDAEDRRALARHLQGGGRKVPFF